MHRFDGGGDAAQHYLGAGDGIAIVCELSAPLDNARDHQAFDAGSVVVGPNRFEIAKAEPGGLRIICRAGVNLRETVEVQGGVRDIRLLQQIGNLAHHRGLAGAH